MPNVVAHISREVKLPVTTANYPQKDQYPRNAFRLIRCSELLKQGHGSLVVINFSPYPLGDFDRHIKQKPLVPYVAISHAWEPELSLKAHGAKDASDPSWLIPITASEDGTERHLRVRIKVLIAIAKKVVEKGCNYFWLDAFSVAHRDAEDRQLQARHLHNIFRQAQCCIILHGGLGCRVIPSLEEESLERFLSSDRTLSAVMCPEPENVEILYGKHRPDEPVKNFADLELYTVTAPFVDVLERSLGLKNFHTLCSAEEGNKESDNRPTDATQPAMDFTPTHGRTHPAHTTENAYRAKIASLCTAMRARQWDDNIDLKYRAIRAQAIFHNAFMRTHPNSDTSIAHLRAVLTRPKDRETNTLFCKPKNKGEKVRDTPSKVPKEVNNQAMFSDVPVELIETWHSGIQEFNYFWLGLSFAIGHPTHPSYFPHEPPLDGDVEVKQWLRGVFPRGSIQHDSPDSIPWTFQAEADVEFEYLAVSERSGSTAHIPVVHLHAYAREVWRSIPQQLNKVDVYSLSAQHGSAKSTNGLRWTLNPSAGNHQLPKEEEGVQYLMVYIGKYSTERGERRAQASDKLKTEIAAWHARLNLASDPNVAFSYCTARAILVRRDGEKSTIESGFVLEPSWGEVIKDAPGLNEPQKFSLSMPVRRASE
ncbi:hypothetical protein TRAPUB_11311 [Trametes pubescens]|uniref:Heterokaryon incompatibility domain-containing protein n=1 Tax=Trametes pubescens TaxID=154538 RepID=A0A1M2VWZ3_TRAPU|nr:hypothetical protein TRAPUB_11311 [Trametes pubescens]